MENKKIFRKLIITSFADFLQRNVMVEIDDDEWEYCIYDNNDYKFKEYEELKSYAPDFALCKSINNKWMYLVGEFSDGKTKNGEVVEGPSTDYTESEEFDSLYDCLRSLLVVIFSTKIKYLFIDHQMSLSDDAKE